MVLSSREILGTELEKVRDSHRMDAENEVCSLHEGWARALYIARADSAIGLDSENVDLEMPRDSGQAQET